MTDQTGKFAVERIRVAGELSFELLVQIASTHFGQHPTKRCGDGRSFSWSYDHYTADRLLSCRVSRASG